MSDSDESVAPLIPLRPDEIVSKIDAANDALATMAAQERTLANRQAAAKLEVDAQLAVQRRMLDRHVAAKRAAHQKEAALLRQKERWEQQLQQIQGEAAAARARTAHDRAIEAVSVAGDGVVEKLEGGTMGVAWKRRWVVAGNGTLRCWRCLTRPNMTTMAPYLSVPLAEDGCELAYFTSYEQKRFKRPHALSLTVKLPNGTKKVLSFAFEHRRALQQWSLAFLDGCAQGLGGSLLCAAPTIFRAAQCGDVRAVAGLLAEAKSRPGGAAATANERNGYAMTPLHYAVKAATHVAHDTPEQQKRFDALTQTIAVLLRHGADPLAPCNTGKTSFDLCANHPLVSTMLKRNLTRCVAKGRWQTATRKVNAARAFVVAGEVGGAARVAKERRVAAARAGLSGKGDRSGLGSAARALNPPPSAASFAGAGGARAQLEAAREAAARDASRYWASRANGHARAAQLEAEATARQLALRARGGAGGMRTGWNPRHQQHQEQRRGQQPRSAVPMAWNRSQRPHSASVGVRGRQQQQQQRRPSSSLSSSATPSMRQKALQSSVQRQTEHRDTQRFSRGFTAASAGASSVAAGAAFMFDGSYDVVKGIDGGERREQGTLNGAQTRRPTSGGYKSYASGSGDSSSSSSSSSRVLACASSAAAAEAALPHARMEDIDPLENPPPGLIITLANGSEISFDTEADIRESLLALAPEGSGGMVNTKELLATLNSLGHSFSWDEQVEFMEEADPQHTGYVDIAALVSHMMHERKRMEEYGKLPKPKSPWPANVKPKYPAARSG